MGAAQDFGVDLARQADVVGVLRPAGDFEIALNSGDRFSDDAQAGIWTPGWRHRRLFDLVLLLAALGLLALDVHDAHGRPPALAASSAARCPARTMFWYAPQRQRLPLTARRISSSLGARCSESNAVTLIIWPGVQKPHWYASASTKARWTGSSSSPCARPSMVV